MKADFSKIFFKSLHYFAVILCTSLFCYLLVDILIKFSNKMTNEAVQIDGKDQQEKFLPCLTACAWNAFKKRGLYFKSSDYQEQTYKKEELFFGKDIFNESLYSIEEVKSIYLGRCYKVCYLKALKKNEAVFVTFWKHRDIKVHIHAKEDEMWISMGIPPKDMTIFQLGIDNKSEILIIGAKLTEKHSTTLNTPSSPCKAYQKGEDDFNRCSQKAVWKRLKEKTNCTLPDDEERVLLMNDVAEGDP